jgi:hypothetical protein
MLLLLSAGREEEPLYETEGSLLRWLAHLPLVTSETRIPLQTQSPVKVAGHAI